VRKNLSYLQYGDLNGDIIAKGCFILVKTIRESCKFTSVMTIIEDQITFATKIAIYNSNYNFIPSN
jgi:hypothetical protein